MLVMSTDIAWYISCRITFDCRTYFFHAHIDEVTTANANSVAILTTILGDQVITQSTDSSFEGQRKAKLFVKERKCV